MNTNENILNLTLEKDIYRLTNGATTNYNRRIFIDIPNFLVRSVVDTIESLREYTKTILIKVTQEINYFENIFVEYAKYLD